MNRRNFIQTIAATVAALWHGIWPRRQEALTGWKSGQKSRIINDAEMRWTRDNVYRTLNDEHADKLMVVDDPVAPGFDPSRPCGGYRILSRSGDEIRDQRLRVDLCSELSKCVPTEYQCKVIVQEKVGEAADPMGHRIISWKYRPTNDA